MANKKISGLTNSLTKATVASNDLTVVVDTSASESKKMTYGEMMSPIDSMFRIAGSSDNTKLVAFEVDGLTTATTRTLTVPDADMTLVGLTQTQTLTNKTLTAPQINMGSDATGDMYYRTAGGAFARLPIGSASQTIQVSSGGIPEWISNPAASDGSTTVKGVYEEATQAEHQAGTTTGGTGADLVVSTRTNGARLYAGYAADAGANDTYVITLAQIPSSYTTGMVVNFKANTANTGAATINVNSLGAKTIVKGVNTTLADGDIAAGQFCTLIYDGTNFVLQNPVANYISGTTYTNGDTTKNINDASTTQTIAHGLGKIPKKVKITAMVGSTTADRISYTVYNGSTQSSVSIYGPAGTASSVNTFSLSLAATPGSNNQTGVVTFDTTNISIAWTSTGSTTGTYILLWEAEG